MVTGLPFTVAAPLTTTGIQGNVYSRVYLQGFAISRQTNIVFTAEGNTNFTVWNYNGTQHNWYWGNRASTGTSNKSNGDFRRCNVGQLHIGQTINPLRDWVGQVAITPR